MFIALLVLTAISLLALIAGTAWWLASSGETRRRRGAEVGVDIMGGLDAGEGAGGNLLEQPVFKGKAAAVEREASISYVEVKRRLRAGDRAALPPLLAMVGLFGFLVFGAAGAVGWDGRQGNWGTDSGGRPGHHGADRVGYFAGVSGAPAIRSRRGAHHRKAQDLGRLTARLFALAIAPVCHGCS